MSLSAMATATYSTKRSPAKVAGKTGAPVTNLTGVAMFSIMPLDSGHTSVTRSQPSPNKATSGRVKDIRVTYAESQTHTDSGVEVTQVPDIKEGDKLVVGSTNYTVQEVQNWPATDSLLAYIQVMAEESR